MKRWQSDFAKINKTENFEEKYEQTTTLSTSCLSRQKGKTYLDFYLTRSYVSIFFTVKKIYMFFVWELESYFCQVIETQL